MTGNPIKPALPKSTAKRYEHSVPLGTRRAAVTANAITIATTYIAMDKPISENVSAALGSCTSSPNADESTKHGNATCSSKRESSRSNSAFINPSLEIHHPNRIGKETVTICNATLVKLIHPPLSYPTRAGAGCLVLEVGFANFQNQAPRPGPGDVSLADQSKIYSFQVRNSNSPITLKNISPRRSKRSRGPPPGGLPCSGKFAKPTSRSKVTRPEAAPARDRPGCYSLSPAVIWVAESAPSAAVAAAASGQTQSVKAG